MAKVTASDKTLVETITAVFKANRNTALKVAEIVERVVKAGYKTASDDLRNVVNVTLFTNETFKRTGKRGYYQLAA